jgi:hypothetical protein
MTPVHSELFAYSTLKTLRTGDASDAGRHQHSAPLLPVSNQVRYYSAGGSLTTFPSTMSRITVAVANRRKGYTDQN